jgi:hypothetical protein
MVSFQERAARSGCLGIPRDMPPVVDCEEALDDGDCSVGMYPTYPCTHLRSRTNTVGLSRNLVYLRARNLVKFNPCYQGLVER